MPALISGCLRYASCSHRTFSGRRKQLLYVQLRCHQSLCSPEENEGERGTHATTSSRSAVVTQIRSVLIVRSALTITPRMSGICDGHENAASLLDDLALDLDLNAADFCEHATIEEHQPGHSCGDGSGKLVCCADSSPFPCPSLPLPPWPRPSPRP